MHIYIFQYSSGNRRIQQCCVIRRRLLSNLTTLSNSTSLPPRRFTVHVRLPISKLYWGYYPAIGNKVVTFSDSKKVKLKVHLCFL